MSVEKIKRLSKNFILIASLGSTCLTYTPTLLEGVTWKTERARISNFSLDRLKTAKHENVKYNSQLTAIYPHDLSESGIRNIYFCILHVIKRTRPWTDPSGLRWQTVPMNSQGNVVSLKCHLRLQTARSVVVTKNHQSGVPIGQRSRGLVLARFRSVIQRGGLV